MSKRKVEIDMKLFMFAIQRTCSFEDYLNSRFDGRTLQKEVKLFLCLTLSLFLFCFKDLVENKKPFSGYISQCFEVHFDIYVNYADR